MKYKKVLIAILLIVGLLFAFYVSNPYQAGYVPIQQDYVAVINLSGVISYSTSPLILWGESITPDDVHDLIQRVKDDPAAKAVVLRINSPGGSAAASEEIYEMISELTKERKVVAYIAEYGASGGYYISLPAEKIVANPSSLTGSVGAVSVIINFAGLFEKIGLKAYTFKSNPLKDVGSPYRNITQEEMDVLQSIVDSTYQEFVDKVIENRGSLIDRGEVLTGRPFTGLQALRVGLVDEVGTFKEALNIAKQLAGLPEDAPYKVISKPRPSLLSLLFGGEKTRLKLSYEVLMMWPLPADLEPKDVLYLLKNREG
jgi:protease-4